MSIYDYKCKDCGYYFEVVSSMAERENPKCCPDCGSYESKQVITRPTPIIDPYRLGRVKPSDSFRDTLRDIKKEHPGSNMNIQ